MGVRKLFKKECLDCKEMFRPTGRSSRYCDSCKEIRMERRTEKIRISNRTSWKKRRNYLLLLRS